MSAYEGGQNSLPDIPAERWRDLYMEAVAEIDRLRELLKRIERNPENVACKGALLYNDLRAAIAHMERPNVRANRLAPEQEQR